MDIESKEKLVDIINNVRIIALDGETPLIPIKPLCQAMGVAFERQFTKLKEDDDLASTITLRVTVGADGKQREMVCLPERFVYGWILTINPKNVAPESREKVRKYRMECFNALWNYFHAQTIKQETYNKQEVELRKAADSFKETIRIATDTIKEAKASLKKVEEQIEAIQNDRLDPRQQLPGVEG